MSIHWDWSGKRIEQESFRLIDEECKKTASALSEKEWRVVQRIVHAAGDPQIAPLIRFANDPISAGRSALICHRLILCDTKMVRAGISLDRLYRMDILYNSTDLRCLLDDFDIAVRAKREGLARSLCGVEEARPLLDGSIVIIGNSPLALARVARYALEENLRPALVIGMPVGFVNVLESKALLAQTDLPYIMVEGRRGGSPLAVATLHAIIDIY